MASVTEYLINLEKLTHTNLDLLEALNNSFRTKQDYLAVNVDDKRYVIPSFIALENKINSLLENFTNLIHAPESGEAIFNMDGNSRAIEVRSYQHVPAKLKLDPINKFRTEENNIFKDFLTPNPYVHFSVPELPNDITSVVIKKIVPVNQELKDFFISQLTDVDGNNIISNSYMYSDLYKKLVLYEKGTDYIEYDSIVKLPIRKNIGTGVYVIDEIVSDNLTENLDEIIELKFKNNVNPLKYMNSLSYRLFDETIEKELKVGDELVTYDSTAKMQIVEIQPNTNTIKVRVLNGEYLNLMPAKNEKNISTLSMLKFFSPIDFNKDKYVKVSLEEDQYVYIAIAPLNDRMNIQSSWGTGLIVNTYGLLNENGTDFKSFYENNVKNIGDTLFEITSMMDNTLTKYSVEQYKQFSKIKPAINEKDLVVYRINKHLDESKSVQNIRSLYSQKHDYITQLDEVQKQINIKNEDLAAVSFDDTTGVRQIYLSQLKELNGKRNELSTVIEKIIKEIANTANSSEVPIENAKYRIRGYFDYSGFFGAPEKDGSNTTWGGGINLPNLINHVKGILVEYRYKNLNQEQGNALSINGQFIFSDWNRLNTFYRKRVVTLNNNEDNPEASTYKFNPEENNDNINEPSFNQIDIPISQGESVDIRLKVIFDMGYPFITTSTDWSDIINIKFPEQYLKDVLILDIIEENNNDIETNRFKSIIKETGVFDHLNDEITDQDVKFFHKPESIASGFYTPERRVIPLKDKLANMDVMLTELYDEVHDSSADGLLVSLTNGNSSVDLSPYQMNYVGVSPYDTFLKKVDKIYQDKGEESKQSGNSQQILPSIIAEGNYIYETETGIVTTTFNLNLHNNSGHSVKLFSLFPGRKNIELNRLLYSKFDLNDFCHRPGDKNHVKNHGGVWMAYCRSAVDEQTDELVNQEKTVLYKLQSANQFITFRVNDVNTGWSLYSLDSSWLPNLSWLSDLEEYVNFDKYIQTKRTESENYKLPSDFTGAFLYPMLSSEYDLNINSNIGGASLTIPSNGTVTIPIVFEYKIVPSLESLVISNVHTVEKTMSFDLRTSLYRDPITYSFKVTAKNVSTIQDKITTANQSGLFKDWANNKLIWPWTRYKVNVK